MTTQATHELNAATVVRDDSEAAVKVLKDNIKVLKDNIKNNEKELTAHGAEVAESEKKLVSFQGDKEVFTDIWTKFEALRVRTAVVCIFGNANLYFTISCCFIKLKSKSSSVFFIFLSTKFCKNI